MTGESVVKQVGSKNQLIINYKGSPYGADVAEHAECMRDVITKLQEVEADEIVLSEYYERIYGEEQVSMLKSIADMLTRFENEAVWSPKHLGTTDKSKNLAKRHDEVMGILNTARMDPFKAYLILLKALQENESKANALAGEMKDDALAYQGTLEYMKKEFEATKMIQKMKAYLAKLDSVPSGRGIYHSLFEVAIKPSFIGSRIFFTSTEKLELIDQYEVLGTDIYIYKHPEKIEFYYYMNPPEYTLPPDKYFLLEKTKEVVSAHRPENVGFMNISQARKYFRKIYVGTISDLAVRNNIKITIEETEKLADIVSRYTIGYGILEILLSDKKNTDVYIDSPLGQKPIYIVHSQYGQCQTNVVFSNEEATSAVSRFRALSGRPFDEAHPILDFDLPDLQTRICIIGPPMANDGTGLVFRLHKTTPWTLSQFLEKKMFNQTAAGLFSFFVDAQASMLIVGSRGAGKTSFLQAMMLEIPQNLRIIVQEDTQELPVPYMKGIGYNIQRLKTRPALGGGGESEVSADDALRTALRLGDSVLIVGEVRSTEARALYEAMRVGAVGNVVMGSIHGESAYSIWDRVVHDLEVPTTSFKATDFCIVAAPIRFKGSLKRNRRVIEVTEVGKEWTEDPAKEGGFNYWMQFDANKDELETLKDNIKKSDWIKRVNKNRGLKFDDIWDEIEARGETKQYLVDLAKKHSIPEIMESQNSVWAHNIYCLKAEQMREEQGKVSHKELLKDWKGWVDNTLAKGILRERKIREV